MPSEPKNVSPVSVPEERQDDEEEYVETASDFLNRIAYQVPPLTIAAGDKLVALADSLDALAVAVKGCDAELPDGTLCGEYDATQIALCSGCRRRRDMVIHGLRDGRTTT